MLKDKEEFNFIPPESTTADVSHRIGNHLLLYQNHPPQADGFCLPPRVSAPSDVQKGAGLVGHFYISHKALISENS
jgi:hypothetical protein